MALEEINKTKEYKLPFELIDDSIPFRIIDSLFSNYEIPQTEADICENTQTSTDQVGLILDKLIQEKIIIKEKNPFGIVFLANFKSPKTMGLFQYYRAVIDENLENLAYVKNNFK